MKNIQIHTDVHKELKIFAAKYGMSIREVVEIAVINHINGDNNEKSI